MMRRAFTLIELLTIVAIAGIMATVAMVSITKGQTGARIKGATRDVFATIRRARSVALVTQKPCIITYSSQVVDGEPCAKVEIDSARMISSSGVGEAWTLSGERVLIGADADVAADEAPAEGEAPVEGGETIEEILFSSISEDVVRGICLKVAIGDEALDVDLSEEKEKTKISVFSNVDYLLGRFKDAKAEAAKAEEREKTEDESAVQSSVDEVQSPVSVVWEVNGRCEPHRVWIYPKGSSPERGLSIKVDRFGAAKVLAAGEDD